ncbi:hypothetical protein [Kribbella sp. VKM Ac-2568]|uniref:hypothetical protein n=1 Tax=Kribbella sp. VKM Ac-2568 TaxID=2512219 RepID=UPI00351A8DF1
MSANRNGGQLVITRLDRLGRSLEHLIELSKDLQGPDLRRIRTTFDPTTTSGAPDVVVASDLFAQVRGHFFTVGPVGLEPTTRGLKGCARP